MYGLSRQRGFTLTEVMIVVAILAVIVAIAIPVFTRWKRKAVRAEVASVLGEISLKQEAYRAEFSVYRGCAATEQSWPALIGGEPVKKPVAPNACWTSMGLRVDPSLYCAYSIYAGPANAWNATGLPAPSSDDQGAFGGTAPSTAWYLGVAECDLDGHPDGAGKNSIFYRTHQGSALGERNPEK